MAWGLQFDRQAFVVAPWFTLAPLFLLLGHHRAGTLGFVHGLAAWLTAIWWIAPTLVSYGGLGWTLGLVGLLLLCAYLALFHLAFARLGAPLWRYGGTLALVGLAALWAALEWLRTFLLSGFPWNLAAYAWVAVPGALPLAAWIGPYGLSLLLVLANGGVARLAQRPGRWGLPGAAIGLPLLLIALGGRFGAGADEAALAFSAGQPVRLLQPNIQNLAAWDPEPVERNYRKIFALSQQSCEGSGALLVWPESAAWPYSYSRDPRFRHDVDALARSGCPVLLNSAHEAAPGVWYNSAFLVAPGAPAARYDKRHLVPFGEYVPFGGVVAFVDRLARNAGDFTAVPEVRLLPWGGERIGLSICFEVTFAGEVAAMVRQGATVLATITNDAWYGDTSAPWQHFRAARFRAAENRRPMLRAAITGVSALIAPDGSVRELLGVNQEGVLAARVRGGTGLTPYARRPWLVPLAATLLALSALLWVRLSPRLAPRPLGRGIRRPV